MLEIKGDIDMQIVSAKFAIGLSMGLNQYSAQKLDIVPDYGS